MFQINVSEDKSSYFSIFCYIYSNSNPIFSPPCTKFRFGNFWSTLQRSHLDSSEYIPKRERFQFWWLIIMWICYYDRAVLCWSVITWIQNNITIRNHFGWMQILPTKWTQEVRFKFTTKAANLLRFQESLLPTTEITSSRNTKFCILIFLQEVLQGFGNGNSDNLVRDSEEEECNSVRAARSICM